MIIDDRAEDAAMNHTLLATGVITEQIERRRLGTPPTAVTRVETAEADQPVVRRPIAWHGRTAQKLGHAT